MKKKLLHDLESSVSDRAFLREHRLPRKDVQAMLRSPSFQATAHRMAESSSYRCDDAFDLIACYPPFAALAGAASGDGAPRGRAEWLGYFYGYALQLSFPEAAEFERDPSKMRIAALYLRILRAVSRCQIESGDGTWQSMYPLVLLPETDVAALEDPSEYRVFAAACESEYVYEMMKLNQEVLGFTTLDHICGVHHLAMRVARQLKERGLPIDLGRVSGAAIGHDIGKYGTKAAELSRIAYYHYYYTGEWFEKHGITYIRNVAINHSTWDLELDALPIESLVLIYADFRVKAAADGRMAFYTLRDSFDVILSKLDNVDSAKENRYRRVYAKLADFEAFVRDLGVTVSHAADRRETLEPLPPKHRKHFTLMRGREITDNAVFASIDHNIEMLYRLRDEQSLNHLLEPVRNSRNLENLRSYIAVLEEYTAYLTQKQKQIVMSFLYEKLELPEEDIRKQCGELIGRVIAGYDEEHRKEIPPSARVVESDADSLAMLDFYMNRFLHPETNIIERHKKYIGYSMRDMIGGYFEQASSPGQRRRAIELILSYYARFGSHAKIRFYLVKAARVLPFGELSGEELCRVAVFISNLLDDEDYRIRLRAYSLMYSIAPFLTPDLVRRAEIARVLGSESGDAAENYARFRLAETLERFGLSPEVTARKAEACGRFLADTGPIFLSNLKTATEDIAKRFQLGMLARNTLVNDYGATFYMAMHLCNMLKVSARESVRNMAGRILVLLCSHLSYEQKNDIAVELIRSLEMESYEFTKYIPPYLANIILQLPLKEFDEMIDAFHEKMSTDNGRLITLMEKTCGHVIAGFPAYRLAFADEAERHEERAARMFGVLFDGFVHASRYANQTAFSVIAAEVFSSEKLSLSQKADYYRFAIKKIMALMSNTDERDPLIFYTNAAALKRLYHFVSTYRHECGELVAATKRRIAFFPGSFDPFTLGHKQIAREIRERGFEVLLALDEFSWSKRTQPNLVRRTIIKKSVAGEIDVYQFPRDISINIANEKDLERLIALFPDAEVYLVVGSDVVENASAYRKDGDCLIRRIPHIVYERSDPGAGGKPEDREKLRAALRRLHPDTLVFRLPQEIENISSTMIRDYIDEKRDISSLLDPMVQNYIYENALYQREPMYKSLMSAKSLRLEVDERPSEETVRSIASLLPGQERAVAELISKHRSDKGFRLYQIRSEEQGDEIEAFAVTRWLRASDLHHHFADRSITSYIREKAAGRLLIVDLIAVRPGTDVRTPEQLILTETLADAMSRDYTYCIYKQSVPNTTTPALRGVLLRQGFVDRSSADSGEIVCCADMSSPCTLNLDVFSMFKEPYRRIPEIVHVLRRCREKLQSALTELYPGHLVLSFDRSMIYENLIRMVARENGMPTRPLRPREVGPAMCVPFGAVMRGGLFPNTVTKTLHTEKYFAPDLKTHQILEYPLYLDIDNQVKTLKSFDRPVILVDDLLNKGYRIQALRPYFNRNGLEVRKLIVGIMSGLGREIAEEMAFSVDAAYFIPKIRVWFYESKLYPFIDGDAVWRGAVPERRLINSVNLIHPYSPANYIKGTSRAAKYRLSETALENARDIMAEVERVYENLNERMLTIRRLSEVLYHPRYPDKGDHILYQDNIRPSCYISDDLAALRRLREVYIDEK